MGHTDATAAPSRIESDGETYWLSPLRDADYGVFTRWVQDQWVDVARRNLDGLTEPERIAVMSAAYERAASITMSSPESLQMMTTIDGASFYLWLSLRRETPGLTLDKTRELCTSPEVVRMCMDRSLVLNATLERLARQQGKDAVQGDGKKKRRTSITKKFTASSRRATAGRRSKLRT